MRDESETRVYQRRGIEFLTTHPFAAYWLDMGMGKTMTALTAFRNRKQAGRAHKAVIFAPLRVATATWPAEIKNWSHLADLTYTVIRAPDRHPRVLEARDTARRAARRLRLPSAEVGRIAAAAERRATEAVRVSLLHEPTDIHIINRERIPWLVEYWKKDWPYDTIIYDESSDLRDIGTARVKSLVKLRRFNLVRCIWELTGTPAPEGYSGLFSQIWLLDKGERFGRFAGAFRKRYFDHNEYARTYDLKPGAADLIIDKVKDIVMVLRAEDHLDVAQPVFVDRVIDLGPELMAQYKTLEDDLVLDLGDAEVIAETEAAKGQKLLQFASGAIYGENREVIPVHDLKVAELREVIAEAQGAPIIAVYWFKHTLDRLKAAFPEGRETDKAGVFVEQWNAGKIPLLFLQPRSGGHGLNLQYGGHIIVYFDIPWPLEAYLQTNARVARQGQTKVPLIVHLIAKGTAEERIVPKLRAKEAGQNYLLTEVKRLRAGRTKI